MVDKRILLKLNIIHLLLVLTLGHLPGCQRMMKIGDMLILNFFREPEKEGIKILCELYWLLHCVKSYMTINIICYRFEYLGLFLGVIAFMTNFKRTIFPVLKTGLIVLLTYVVYHFSTPLTINILPWILVRLTTKKRNKNKVSPHKNNGGSFIK